MALIYAAPTLAYYAVELMGGRWRQAHTALGGANVWARGRDVDSEARRWVRKHEPSSQ